MWTDEAGRAPVAEFLGWMLFMSVLVQGTLLLLEPCSIAYADGGAVTVGYILYALIGMLADTPCPFIALFITLHRAERITWKEYFKRILQTPRPLAALGITGLFCALALAFALTCGTPNGEPWYMLPLGFLVMIPFVGAAEESGWRGFLQPELEKRFPFPVAVSFTAVIWYIWHLPLWLQSTSNHYSDSLIGFAITIFVWAFAAAAIYKASKSVMACSVYHAFVNAIGAIYNWNSLFDAYPKSGADCLYFGIVFVLSLVIWTMAERKEHGGMRNPGSDRICKN